MKTDRTLYNVKVINTKKSSQLALNGNPLLFLLTFFFTFFPGLPPSPFWGDFRLCSRRTTIILNGAYEIVGTRYPPVQPQLPSRFLDSTFIWLTLGSVSPAWIREKRNALRRCVMRLVHKGG